MWSLWLFVSLGVVVGVVAGGWVRDKVLGLESNDIDIAIDNMTGEGFLNIAHDYFK